MSTGEVDTPTTDSNPYTSPTDQDGHPLTWDGNDGRILGLVHELGLHTVRKAILQTFIKKRVRVLSNGLVVAEAVSVVPFVMGTNAEPDRTLDTMCPPGPARYAEVNAWRATPAGGNEVPLTPITAMPTGASDIVRINSMAIDEDDGKRFSSRSLARRSTPPPSLRRRAAVGTSTCSRCALAPTPPPSPT